jgi:threonyl-tRNA synthetase
MLTYLKDSNSEKDLQKIEQKIIELARQKNDIIRSEISKADALKKFTKK